MKKLTKKENDFYIEAIDPDSLEDAFEVASDSIDKIFNKLMNW